MKPWSEQIDELVQLGRYADALALLDTIEEAVLADKVQNAINSCLENLATKKGAFLCRNKGVREYALSMRSLNFVPLSLTTLSIPFSNLISTRQN